MSLSIERNGQALVIRMGADAVSVHQSPDGYVLCANTGQDSLEIQLSQSLLQTLADQSQELLTQSEAREILEEISSAIGEADRWDAASIEDLDDGDIQTLIRECQCDDLVVFLWFMKSANLMHKILRNMSERAAEMLMDDLERDWYGHSPDNTTPENAQRGRQAVQNILNAAGVAGIKLPSGFLTQEEVDALLCGVVQGGQDERAANT